MTEWLGSPKEGCHQQHRRTQKAPEQGCDAWVVSWSLLKTADKRVLDSIQLTRKCDVEWISEPQATYPGWGVSRNECAGPDGEGLNETGKGGKVYPDGHFQTFQPLFFFFLNKHLPRSSICSKRTAGPLWPAVPGESLAKFRGARWGRLLHPQIPQLAPLPRPHPCVISGISAELGGKTKTEHFRSSKRFRGIPIPGVF